MFTTDLLSTYHSMFPEAQQDEQWQGLVNSLYRNIARSDTRLFPVFNRVSDRIYLLLSEADCSKLAEESVTSSVNLDAFDSRMLLA